MTEQAQASTKAPPTPLRRMLVLALKLSVTGLAIWFLLAHQPVADITRTIASLSPLTVLLGIAVQVAAIVLGAVRWRVMLHAYGAHSVPPLRKLIKVYFVGQFYNTFVPGAVGGDLLRGVVSRRAFTGGATSGVAVVFVERALGAAAVLALTAVATALFASDRFGHLVPYCVLGLFGVLAGVIALGLGPRLARFMPGVLGRILGGIPRLSHVLSFVLGFVASLGTQSLVVLCGHVFIHALDRHITLAHSFVAMPLAGAAGYFPITVAGIGPRDWVVKNLYVQLGASEASATATAFTYLFASLAAALIGGIVQLVRPIDVDHPPAADAP